VTRKHRRLAIVLGCALGIGSASALTLSAFSDTMVFFMSPGDIAAKQPAVGRMIRLGGLVEAGSLKRETVDGEPVAAFRVTDGRKTIAVRYTTTVLPRRRCWQSTMRPICRKTWPMR
jgi:cytochrome c-type biogenesis protein CcmE